MQAIIKIMSIQSLILLILFILIIAGFGAIFIRFISKESKIIYLIPLSIAYGGSFFIVLLVIAQVVGVVSQLSPKSMRFNKA